MEFNFSRHKSLLWINVLSIVFPSLLSFSMVDTKACCIKWLVQDSSFILNRAICLITDSGPIDAPILHPVIANFFENVYSITVLCFIPGRLTIDIGASLEYRISKYASSLKTHKSCLTASSASDFNSPILDEALNGF